MKDKFDHHFHFYFLPRIVVLLDGRKRCRQLDCVHEDRFSEFSDFSSSCVMFIDN